MVLFVSGVFSQICASDIVINEVMSNVKGSDSGVGSPGDRNEFVEIVNISKDTIDLSLFQVSDLDAVDDIIVWTDALINDPDVIFGTTLLLPGGYAVILDPEYTDAGNGNYIMPYDFPENTLVVTVGNTTIGDGLSTKDPVILLNSSLDTVSSYGTPMNENDSIPYDPGDGISSERVSLYYPDNELYWASCEDSSGSTPGGANSCYSASDIVFPDYGFNIYPGKINKNELVTVSLLLQNQSEDTIENVNIDFFSDDDWDSAMSTNELIKAVFEVEPIAPFGGTLGIDVEWMPVSSGNKRIGAKLKESEKAENFRMLKVGNPIGDVVINEIMCNPDAGGEWIELYNRSSHPIDLCGWEMGVGFGKKTGITNKHFVLKANEYVIFVDDKTIFETKWGNVPSKIIESEKWLTLKNDSDTLTLMNGCLFCYDAVYYRDSYESGISIERINPDAESRFAWNWGSSCDYKGGSPGTRNSIFATSTSFSTVLSLSPNPFSPDGDGYEERIVVSYELPFNQAKVNLSVYTRSGVRKCCLLKEQDSGRNGEFIWDGKDEIQKKLPVGLYVVFLEAVDKLSDRKVVKKAAVVIARRK